MSTQEFAERLQAKLEATSEFWRARTEDPHGISTAVQVALSEVADCIRHALAKPKSRRKK